MKMNLYTRMYGLLVKFFLLLVVFSCARQVTPVSKLSQIPKEDREKIEKLFSFLVWDETFAYVLFGSKPMSVATHDKTVPTGYLEKYQYIGYELESLWKTWEKYAHLFPMSEFIFITEDHEKWLNINLLNKSNCLNVIEKNLFLFQEKMGCNFNAAEIFDYIVANAQNDIFKNSLKKSQGLYGILLGYGSNNSLGFENYFSAHKNKEALPPEEQVLNMEDSSRPILPCFASFSAKETESLISDYQNQRERILSIYSGQNFLEITINRLTIPRIDPNSDNKPVRPFFRGLRGSGV